MCKCNQHATPSPQQPDQLQPDALKMLPEENIMRQQTQTITKDQSIQYELLHSSNKVNFSRVPIADIFQTKRRRRRRQVSPLSIVVDVMPLHVMSSVYCSCMMKTTCATIVLLLYHALYAFATDASFKMSILQWRALVFGKKLVGLGSRERAHPPRHVLGNILCPQDAPMIPLHDEDINTNTDTHTYKHKYKHKYKL